MVCQWLHPILISDVRSTERRVWMVCQWLHPILISDVNLIYSSELETGGGKDWVDYNSRFNPTPRRLDLFCKVLGVQRRKQEFSKGEGAQLIRSPRKGGGPTLGPRLKSLHHGPKGRSRPQDTPPPPDPLLVSHSKCWEWRRQRQALSLVVFSSGFVETSTMTGWIHTKH